MAVVRKVYVYGLALLGVLVACVLISVFQPKFSELRAMRAKKAALEVKNRELEDGVRELQKRQAQFLAESGAVERTAHEANMVRPDEVVFKFTTGTTSAVEGRLP